MRTRFYLVCGVLLVAAAVGLLWWSPWEPREPVYDGKPLTYWLNKNPDYATGQLLMIAQQILAMSPRSITADSNAVPFLVKALMRDNGLGAAFYRDWLWPKLPAPVQKRMPRPWRNDLVCEHAAAILASMGPMAETAVPALVMTLKQSKNPFVREMAVLALYNIGRGNRAATEALASALNSSDGTVRQSVTNSLLGISHEAAATFGVNYSWR